MVITELSTLNNKVFDNDQTSKSEIEKFGEQMWVMTDIIFFLFLSIGNYCK